MGFCRGYSTRPDHELDFRPACRLPRRVFRHDGQHGAELYDMSWVQEIVLFFSYLVWALYGTGLVVSVFECGIEYQSGRGSI